MYSVIQLQIRQIININDKIGKLLAAKIKMEIHFQNRLILVKFTNPLFDTELYRSSCLSIS